MKKNILVVLGCSVSLSACAQWLDPPQSIGDVNAGYRYIAIDPLPVSFNNSFAGCTAPAGGTPNLMNALHDLAARVSTEDITGEVSGGITGVTAGASGRSYRVTQDFIAYDTARLRFEVPPGLINNDGTPSRGNGQSMVQSSAQIRLLGPAENARSGNQVITVPVYVGVGLRLTANVQVRSGKVNLTDLGAISAAARADRIRGGLVSQTLGLGGSKVMTMVPLPGELNPTTIQAATVAMGQIKALLFDAETQRWPRVVGIHYPFAQVQPALVNAIVSALTTRRIEWRPCATDDTALRLI